MSYIKDIYWRLYAPLLPYLTSSVNSSPAACWDAPTHTPVRTVTFIAASSQQKCKFRALVFHHDNVMILLVPYRYGRTKNQLIRNTWVSSGDCVHSRGWTRLFWNAYWIDFMISVWILVSAVIIFTRTWYVSVDSRDLPERNSTQWHRNQKPPLLDGHAAPSCYSVTGWRDPEWV